MGSSFLLSRLLSGRMTLKTMVVLCLVLVGFIEANPVPENDGYISLVGKVKRSPNEEIENGLNDDDTITENEPIDLLDTENNESEDTTDDSEQVDDVNHDISERRKRSPGQRRCKDGWQYRWPYTCGGG